MTEYLQEDLSEVEYLELPLLIGGQMKTVKQQILKMLKK